MTIPDEYFAEQEKRYSKINESKKASKEEVLDVFEPVINAVYSLDPTKEDLAVKELRKRLDKCIEQTHLLLSDTTKWISVKEKEPPIGVDLLVFVGHSGHDHIPSNYQYVINLSTYISIYTMKKCYPKQRNFYPSNKYKVINGQRCELIGLHHKTGSRLFAGFLSLYIIR